MTDATNTRLVKAMPTTMGELLNQYKLKSAKSFTDAVETHFKTLFPNPEFQEYLKACFNEESVEGTTDTDDILAANMLRDAALEARDMIVGKAKLVTVKRSLKTVMKRYGMGREERRLDTPAE
jgi:hypothetical protein